VQAKLAELQDLVMRLVGERNEWYSRYMSAIGNPDLLPGATAQSHSYKLIPIQFAQMSRFSEPVQLQTQSQSPERPGSAPDGTARQIMQLLQEIQNPQARPAPFLGENPCIPFFYRPDEHDEVKILVV
uniref:Golgin subfamily A conserved domain-containing protein n=1 Tax=Sinocyclocheilus grahami TaxID=75366 RepID=A0A672PTA1_SINGR